MAAEKKFFLGIGGQQAGPFSDAEVSDKIISGEVRTDTLVWYEGLNEWQRADTIAYFQPAFKKPKKAKVGSALAGPGKTELTSESLRPVFSSREAVFSRRKGPRPLVLAVGGLILAAGFGAFWLMDQESAAPKLQATGLKKLDLTTRPGRLHKADADYLLNSTVIPDDFLRLVTENSTDEVGKRAAAQLEAIYKKKNRTRELAELYEKVGRHEDAIAPFMEDKLFVEAERNAYQGYEKASDKKLRRRMLMKSIELTTGPLQDIKNAIPRIRKLEAEYPNEPHPYGYYLLSPEKKIADLFSRTSFFFVENLITHIKAEFPQLKLGGRPSVAVIKEGPDRYRIVGTYKGDVVLNYDRLKKIRFEYWLVVNDWNLVATNVTTEREAWARTNRGRHIDTVRSADVLLLYLEGVMRARFPKLGLHDRVSPEEFKSALRQTASN